VKRANGLFEQVTAVDKLLAAYRRAFRGSGRTVEACVFTFNLEEELFLLKNELESGEYIPQKYRYFRISEPKPREISVAAFRDRVVHHAVVAAIEPLFERCFIHHSYATRKGKGNQRAVRSAQSYLRRGYYYLKADVEKYFDSIDHNILLALISRKLKDRQLLSLIGTIINNSDRSRNLECGKGLPIGNLTSQFLANVYLNGLDHYVLEELKAGYYIRYMDDFVLFADDKTRLREWRDSIASYLEENLSLKLKEKATFINSRQNGLPFLGLRIFPNLLRLKPGNVRRLKRRILMRMEQLLAGEISETDWRQSLESIFGYMEFADTFMLRRSLFSEYG